MRKRKQRRQRKQRARPEDKDRKEGKYLKNDITWGRVYGEKR